MLPVQGDSDARLVTWVADAQLVFEKNSFAEGFFVFLLVFMGGYMVGYLGYDFLSYYTSSKPVA